VQAPLCFILNPEHFASQAFLNVTPFVAHTGSKYFEHLHGTHLLQQVCLYFLEKNPFAQTTFGHLPFPHLTFTHLFLL